MTNSDREGIERSGATARIRGESFHANPNYSNPDEWATIQNMLEWHEAACAWASGWLKEDRGRDTAIAGLLRRKFW